MSRPEMQVLNRQVTKRQRFYFYEKMRRIQRNIEVGDLSMRAAWKVANLNHRSSSPGKEILDVCRRRETRKPRVCVWDHYQFCMNLKSHCCVKNSSYRNEEWLFHQDWSLSRPHHCQRNFLGIC